MYKYIYFDWSGTLAKPRTRHLLLNGDKTVLYSDTETILNYLKNRGYILGIISNTKMTRDKFIFGLQKIGLYKYFDKIVLSSDPGMCRKSCNLIFKTVYKPGTIYIGNNFHKDIIGAKNNDFMGIYIKREHNDGLIGKFQGDITIKNLYELKEII